MKALVLKYGASGRQNKLGQAVYDYSDGDTLEGWLDLLTGVEAERAQALQSSSHIFITAQVGVDVTQLDRLKIGDVVYEVTFIDNPVNLGHHLEIYLKVVA